jgi:diguanylate cyclase (GGDEF)-like protein
LPSAWTHPRIDRLRTAIAAWLERRPLICGLVITAATAVGLTLSQRVFDRIVPTVHGGWAIYWPFNGVMIAVLLLCRRRFWPWIMAGFLCAFIRIQVAGHDPAGEIATIVLCNCAQILIAALLLPPFRSLKEWLLEPHLNTRFVLFGVALGSALTAFPVAYYFVPKLPGQFWNNVMWWTFSDALGAALWVPLILVLFSRETYDLFRWRALPETLGLLLALCSITWAAFSQNLYPLGFVPYPLLLFVALRLGFSGAVLGANLLTLIVASRSLHEVGPFRVVTRLWNPTDTVVLQAFCILAALFVFPLSVAMVSRKNLEERLRQAFDDMKQLATVDPLTGLANRRQFDKTLEYEWRRAVRSATPVGLLMIDADCFKAYNDHYGHVAGDECLRQIAALLSASSIRRHDLIARYGGEEFAILLPGSMPQHLEALAESLCASIITAAIPHEKNPHRTVTISIGCAAQIPRLHESPKTLIDAADRALYEAKQSGRNRVCCHCKTATDVPLASMLEA